MLSGSLPCAYGAHSETLKIKSKMEKLLYKGTFNWQGEIHIFYRHAVSKAQAKVLMLRELAGLVDRSVKTLVCYFGGRKDNFSLEEEK